MSNDIITTMNNQSQNGLIDHVTPSHVLLYNRALERHFSNCLRQTFWFFRLSVFRKSIPTYIGRMQGSGGYLAVDEKRDFWGRNSAGVPTDFPCAEYRRETESADDIQSKTGRTEILRATSRRNKGSKKVLRLSAVRCRGFLGTTSTSGAITDPLQWIRRSCPIGV